MRSTEVIESFEQLTETPELICFGLIGLLLLIVILFGSGIPPEYPELDD